MCGGTVPGSRGCVLALWCGFWGARFAAFLGFWCASDLLLVGLEPASTLRRCVLGFSSVSAEGVSQSLSRTPESTALSVI